MDSAKCFRMQNASETQSPSENLVPVEVMAFRLGVSTRTLHTWTKQGLVPRVTIGRTVRYDVADVMAHLKRSERVVSHGKAAAK